MTIKLRTPGELPLIVDNKKRIVALDSIEPWQIDQVFAASEENSILLSNACLSGIDGIVDNWINNLTDDQWSRIKRQRSLFGIPLPKAWLKVWRIILKEPGLRNSWEAAKDGRKLGSYIYVWNIWAEECIEKYLDELDLELLTMFDQGYLHTEIGHYLFEKYGDKFWKPRKARTTTTPEQVVNNYLYTKLPTKIVRGELLDYCLKKIDRASK